MAGKAGKNRCKASIFSWVDSSLSVAAKAAILYFERCKVKKNLNPNFIASLTRLYLGGTGDSLRNMHDVYDKCIRGM